MKRYVKSVKILFIFLRVLLPRPRDEFFPYPNAMQSFTYMPDWRGTRTNTYRGYQCQSSIFTIRALKSRWCFRRQPQITWRPQNRVHQSYCNFVYRSEVQSMQLLLTGILLLSRHPLKKRHAPKGNVGHAPRFVGHFLILFLLDFFHERHFISSSWGFFVI